MRILLVNTNAGGNVARKVVLEALGYQGLVAMSGRDALAWIEASDFALVITGFRLGDITGCELIEIGRRRRPMLPFLLLSGVAGALGLTPASTGAVEVIQKSADEVSQMLRAVRGILERPMRKMPQSERWQQIHQLKVV